LSNSKLFISYSWSSHDHEQLVLQIATELTESGVDVILDKWDLKEGHDAYAFMEKMVTDPEINKVAIISDRAYAEKADGRSGGVGTETQIISREVYEKQEQDKFVVVVTERDESGKAHLPTYYKSRIYIDLSEPDSYAENFEKLLRWIYNKPLYVKPEVGKKPSFLEENESVSLGTSSAFKRSVDAIKNDKSTASGCFDEYLSLFSENLERFRVHDVEGEIDDAITSNMESFIPSRNEYVQLMITVAQYKPIPEFTERIHRFIESLIPYMDRPEHLTSYNRWEFDNYKFIVHELFLYTLAVFLKYERFELAAPLLIQQYFVEGRSEYGRDTMIGFENIRQYMASLEHRNRRLKTRRFSLRADLLKERCHGTGLNFRFLMQADFVAFMRAEISASDDNDRWWPETLFYLGHYGSSFEIFARAKSKKYFDRVKTVLGIDSPDDLAEVLESYKQDRRSLPRWEMNSFSPSALLGYESLGTLP
jgi:hypothetical protein